MNEKDHWAFIEKAIRDMIDTSDIKTLFAEAFQDAFEQGYNQAYEEMGKDKP